MRGGRFIPAGAGNTKFTALGVPVNAVHPRWRGEHSAVSSHELCRGGSSPLARGTRSCRSKNQGVVRFIPAGAGNTGAAGIFADSHAGSSPLARGTPGGARLVPKGRRFIPAGAGNTWRHRSHCGADDGSSPLARGTPHRMCINVDLRRFIPAGAGNTLGTQLLRHWHPVHPRWRGEHTSVFDNTASMIGSSPLARGTRGIPPWG